MRYLTPGQLDLEKMRWTRWKGQHGGWNQALWVRLQETWRTETEPWAEPWRVTVKEGTQ